MSTLVLATLACLLVMSCCLSLHHELYRGSLPRKRLSLLDIADLQDAGIYTGKYLFTGANPIYCSDIHSPEQRAILHKGCKKLGPTWEYSNSYCDCYNNDVVRRRTSICRALYYKDTGACCFHDDEKTCYFKAAGKSVPAGAYSKYNGYKFI